MSVSDDPPEGPFDQLALDEAWAQGASIHEPSARARSLQADLARIEDEQAEEAARRWRTARRRRIRRSGLVMLAIVLFASAVAVADRTGGGGGGAAGWSSAGGGEALLTLTGHPPAVPARSSTPLGRPDEPDAEGGTYAFIQTQRDGTTPVAYDPCRPIEIVVNNRTAPEGGPEIVDSAVRIAAEVSGLEITIVDETDEGLEGGRDAYQPDRYGERWAPVLLAWSDPDEVPDLGGNIAGVASSAVVQPSSGPLAYVTGVVALDGPDLEAILARDDGERSARDVVLHELGHLLGLDHVDDQSELMYPEGQHDLHDYQQGDRTGLTQLGQGPCIPRL